MEPEPREAAIMSIYLLNKVFELPLRPAEKLALSVLADLANETGICWPSLAYVAPRASVSIRTLQRIISSLERQGLIKRQPRYRANGSRTSSEFIVLPEHKGGDKSSLPTATSSTSPPAVMAGSHDTTDTPIPHREPSIENHNHSLSQLIYPRSFDEARIKTANSLLSLIPSKEAQLLLDETAARMALGRVTSPLSYLRALIKRHKAGEFIPELADQISNKRQAKAGAIEQKPARLISSDQIKRNLIDLRKVVA
jgi:hypothetical protein